MELRQDERCAVLDLLHCIRHTIGTVHLNLTHKLIHRKLVVLEIEFAIRQSQTLNHAQLRRFLSRGKLAASYQPPTFIPGRKSPPLYFPANVLW